MLGRKYGGTFTAETARSPPEQILSKDANDLVSTTLSRIFTPPSSSSHSHSNNNGHNGNHGNSGNHGNHGYHGNGGYGDSQGGEAVLLDHCVHVLGSGESGSWFHPDFRFGPLRHPRMHAKFSALRSAAMMDEKGIAEDQAFTSRLADLTQCAGKFLPATDSSSSSSSSSSNNNNNNNNNNNGHNSNKNNYNYGNGHGNGNDGGDGKNGGGASRGRRGGSSRDTISGTHGDGSHDAAHKQRQGALLSRGGGGGGGGSYGRAQRVLVAQDQRYEVRGRRVAERSKVYTPNRHVIALANENPGMYVPAISLHPYRTDACAELDRYARLGVRLVHWHPAMMGVDPAHPACLPFYRRMVVWDMVLLCHAGAAGVRDREDLGNPLRLRDPLRAGVTVVALQAASKGTCADLQHPARPAVPAWSLLLRLLKDSHNAGKLFVDISTAGTHGRCPALAALLDDESLHDKIVYASGYPRPAVKHLSRPKELASHGLVTREEAALLEEVRAYNPLLYDVVAKATARGPASGKRLPSSVFVGNPFGLQWPPAADPEALLEGRDAASILEISKAERRARRRGGAGSSARGAGLGGSRRSPPPIQVPGTPSRIGAFNDDEAATRGTPTRTNGSQKFTPVKGRRPGSLDLRKKAAEGARGNRNLSDSSRS